jgi:hypothetical protein
MQMVQVQKPLMLVMADDDAQMRSSEAVVRLEKAVTQDEFNV